MSKFDIPDGENINDYANLQIDEKSIESEAGIIFDKGNQTEDIAPKTGKRGRKPGQKNRPKSEITYNEDAIRKLVNVSGESLFKASKGIFAKFEKEEIDLIAPPLTEVVNIYIAENADKSKQIAVFALFTASLAIIAPRLINVVSTIKKRKKENEKTTQTD